MDYNYSQHVHKFSIWTASRAVSRGFTGTLKISEVINKINLKDFADNNASVNAEEYNKIHKDLCDQIIKNFKYKKIECSYGRAAKIIAIYLKTSLMMCNNKKNNLLNVMHPPIDSILLKNISSQLKVNKMNIKKISWTKLTKQEYWKLYDEIIRNKFEFNWKLEKFWQPV